LFFIAFSSAFQRWELKKQQKLFAKKSCRFFPVIK
jgi:hypothetical protein